MPTSSEALKLQASTITTFSDFTINLIDQVFNGIVNASIRQMSAFADLVARVSKPLEEFQNEIAGSNASEQKIIADTYIRDVLKLTVATNVNLSASDADDLKKHFAGIAVSDKPIDDSITASGSAFRIPLTGLEPFVTDKLRGDAAKNYEALTTVLKLGMQKIVITEGEIATSVFFRFTESENARSSGEKKSVSAEAFVKNKTNAGLGSFKTKSTSGLELSLSVLNESASAASNITEAIMGKVTIKFRTDSFPSA